MPLAPTAVCHRRGTLTPEPHTCAISGRLSGTALGLGLYKWALEGRDLRSQRGITGEFCLVRFSSLPDLH